MCSLSNIERKFCNKWKYALIKHDFHIPSLTLRTAANPSPLQIMDRDAGCCGVVCAHCLARHDRSKTAPSALLRLYRREFIVSQFEQFLANSRVYLGVHDWLIPVLLSPPDVS
jgi:hypothetical protein